MERFVAQDVALNARNRKPLCLKESRDFIQVRRILCLYTPLCVRFDRGASPYFLAANTFFESQYIV